MTKVIRSTISTTDSIKPHEIEIVKHSYLKIDENVFKVGDFALYAMGMNIDYYGIIVDIKEKTVTVKEEYSDTLHNMRLNKFVYLNNEGEEAVLKRRNRDDDYLRRSY